MLGMWQTQTFLAVLSPVVSSGSITVNADSSVQLLAEEAVTLDMLDLGVSVWGKQSARLAGAV
jgi:hypothetical protein